MKARENSVKFSVAVVENGKFSRLFMAILGQWIQCSQVESQDSIPSVTLAFKPAKSKISRMFFRVQITFSIFKKPDSSWRWAKKKL